MSGVTLLKSCIKTTHMHTIQTRLDLDAMLWLGKRLGQCLGHGASRLFFIGYVGFLDDVIDLISNLDL